MPAATPSCVAMRGVAEQCLWVFASRNDSTSSTIRRGKQKNSPVLLVLRDAKAVTHVPWPSSREVAPLLDGAWPRRLLPLIVLGADRQWKEAPSRGSEDPLPKRDLLSSNLGT